jgi:hypothetical protein
MRKNHQVRKDIALHQCITETTSTITPKEFSESFFIKFHEKFLEVSGCNPRNPRRDKPLVGLKLEIS